MEIRIGDEPPGDVGGTAVVENALLELLQGGRAEAVAPEAPRGVQEVEMRIIHGELAAYRHDETRADDREVERLSVVRRARPERLDLGLQALDKFPFRPEVPKHGLPQDQFLTGEVSDANEKDVRARPARETRRLHIPEQDVLPVVWRIGPEAE